MTGLVLYSAAREALAKAHRVDEVKDIRDKSIAMQHYAVQAKDRELIEWATEIRLRAERKAGELLIKMAERGERVAGGGDLKSSSKGTLQLADLNLTKKQSHLWQKVAALDDGAFEQKIKTAQKKAVAVVDGLSQEEKAARRAEREAELGARQAELPDKKYAVIVADPEWRFEPWSRETGMDRAADNHYPTSVTEVIAARDVPSITADDCVLFLWATAPMLPHALLVMAAWGFDYKSQFVWAKDRIATGYWNRNRHELLLVGVRGDIPAPAMGKQFDSLIEAPVTGHSAKPAVFLEMIEAYFPNLPKIELNRRGPARSGWDAWGNEVFMPEAAE